MLFYTQLLLNEPVIAKVQNIL